MFEVFSGHAPRTLADRHPLTVAISIIGHSALLVGLIVVPLLYATDELPPLPAMMTFVAATPAPPPPPPPPAPAPARRDDAIKAVATSGPLPAPIEAAHEIRPETGLESGVKGGVPGGVEGGVEGGVPGGIVGGIVASTPIAPPPPPPVAPPRTPIRVGGNLKAPALVTRVDPIYPDIAVMTKITGMVILEALVDAGGCVQSVKVLRSDALLLNQAAVDAVKQWQYSPLMLNGEAQPFIVTVTLRFSIRQPS